MSGILQTLFLGAAAAVKDAYFNLVTLLLPGNGTNGAQNNTFLDSSSNNFTITRNGNTTQGTFSPFSQTGWSNYFGSSSNYLTTPASNSSATFGTGTYTVEAWIYPTAYNASNSFFLGSNGSGTFQAGLTSAGYLFGSCAAVGNFTASTSIIPLNTWTHVALVRNSTSSNGGTYYVNGVAAGTYTDANNYTATPNVWIGTTSPAASYFFSGYISNLRVVKGSTVYTGNFTPSTTPLTAITNTSLLTCQSNRFVDNSSNAFTITTNGTPSVQAFSPFAPGAAYDSSVVGGSAYFDGSGDSLSLNQSVLNPFGTAITIDFWFYPTATGTNLTLFQYGSGAIGDVQCLYDGGNNIKWQTGGNAGSSNTNVKPNQWNFITCTKDASNNFIAYVNGTTGTTVALTPNSTTSLSINSNAAGYMSGFRVTTGAANVPSGIPTSPPTTTVAAGTCRLLLNFTNAGITDATAKNDLETVGNAQISTTQSKFGGSSMYFDGSSGNYLKSNAAANDLYSFGTGDYAVEFWIYPTSLTGNKFIIDFRPTSSTTGLCILIQNSTLLVQINGTNLFSPSFTLSNQWSYIAVARTSGTTRLYINGSISGSGVSDTASYANGGAGRPGIGGGGYNTTEIFSGYIDDLRITKGSGRGYTGSTINVPSVNFPLQ